MPTWRFFTARQQCGAALAAALWRRLAAALCGGGVGSAGGSRACCSSQRMLCSKYVFGASFTRPESPVWVGLNSLAMGDPMACEFAQGSHVGVMLQYGVAEVSQLLSLHNPLPRGLHHVIIDNLVVLEKILTAELVFVAGGIPANVGCQNGGACEKGLQDSGAGDQPKESFCRWGINLDGEKGLRIVASDDGHYAGSHSPLGHCGLARSLSGNLGCSLRTSSWAFLFVGRDLRSACNGGSKTGDQTF